MFQSTCDLAAKRFKVRYYQASLQFALVPKQFRFKLWSVNTS